MQWQFIAGTVLANQCIDKDIWQLTIQCPEIAAKCKPGNFIMLRTWNNETYLPRPMAVYKHDEVCLEVVYRIKGLGTELLMAALPGSAIRLMGPLGSAVTHTFAGKKVALIGRGVGITPLMPVAQTAAEQGAASITTFLSARQPSLLLGQEDFGQWGKVYIQTDDQDTTMITEILAKLLAAGKQFDYIYLSGSKRLVKHCQALADAYSFHAFVFLESRMACGIGYCKGCAVEIKSEQHKYSLCCKEGPLYAVEDVVFN